MTDKPYRSLEEKNHSELVELCSWAMHSIAQERFDDIVKEILAATNTRMTDPVKLVALLRSSYSARRKIPRWNGLVKISIKYLNEIGRDGESILQGLYDPKYKS